MHNTKLVLAFLATSLVSVYGQNLQDGSIDQNDVPPECRQTCTSAIDLTTRCDNQNDDNNDDDDDNNTTNVNDDQAERDCVCNDQNARQYLTDCGSCVALYPNFFIDRDDDDGLNDNEVDLWLRQCNFGGVNTTSATITSAPTATPTGACSTVVITTTIRDDDDNDDNDDPNDDLDDIRTITTNSVVCGTATTPAPTAISTSVIVATSGSSTFTSTVVFSSTPTGATTTGSTAPQQTDNAAAGIAAPLAFAGAGACFLFAAFAL